MKALASRISFLQLLSFSAIAVFLGRAYQHLFHDAPFRAILWDETLMGEAVGRIFNVSWDVYLRDPKYDLMIMNLIFGFGLVYLLGTLISFFKRKSALNYFLIFGSFCLMFLAYLYCKEKFYTPAQFFEYSLQFGSPLFLFLVIRESFKEHLILFMKIAIALTFVSHGLYALGIYPVPGNFVQMTLNILPVQEKQAIQFLALAGILDIVISILIFVPGKLSRYALIYAIIWGALTAFARIVANFEFENMLASVHQWLHQSVYRFPHFLIPMAVLTREDLRDVQ